MRVLDLICSGIAILLLSPIFLLVTIILRMTGEGEIFYRQTRVGRNKKEFFILKFATMVRDSPNIGAGTITLKDDPRVLPVGKVLRKTKVNELPQLLNIFLGDMAIVGPRPLVPSGDANYGKKTSDIIRSVRPGLTGLGSIMLRDEEAYYSHRDDAAEFYRQVISPYKESLEVWYVNNRNILMDLKLILLTAVCVFFPAFSPGTLGDDMPCMPNELAESKAKDA